MQKLIADSITKHYGERKILNGAYIDCVIGEIVGLLGRNGSGKSTLLKIMFGSENADFKHIRINDKIYSKPYLSAEIFFLAQNFSIPENIKLAQFVNLFCTKYKSLLLNIPLFKNNINEQIGNLSGGQKRMIFCLTAIYSDAQYVLLDEPFSHIAPNVIEEIKSHLVIMKEKKGFILTDHMYKQIIDISDRIVLLHNGSNYNIKNLDDLILHGYISHL